MAKQYRLSITENDTHKSIKSYRLTKLSFAITAGAIAVGIIALIYCLIAFTPLRATIPGYPDARSKSVAVDNAIKIDSLESMITRWELYAENLSRVLTGEQTISMDSVIQGNLTRYLSAKSAEELAARDSILRETVRKEEQFGLSGQKDKVVPLEGMHFFTPVKGVVSNGFDAARHPAVDITGKAGDIVCAALGGTVIYAGWSEEEAGSLSIQSPGDVVTTYMHCQKVTVSKGDKIKAGSPVALLGETASLTKGNYLHFELWYKGEAVDPSKYMNF